MQCKPSHSTAAKTFSERFWLDTATEPVLGGLQIHTVQRLQEEQMEGVGTEVSN